MYRNTIKASKMEKEASKTKSTDAGSTAAKTQIKERKDQEDKERATKLLENIDDGEM